MNEEASSHGSRAASMRIFERIRIKFDRAFRALAQGEPEISQPAAIDDEIARLLSRWVDAAAIPSVMRRPVEEFGGRSLLEAAQAGEMEAVRAYIDSTFDLRRIQP